jgi:hypothetical protein
VLHRLHNLGRRWNETMTPALKLQLDHRRAQIENAHRRSITACNVQNEVVRDWKQKMGYLHKEEQYYLNQTQRIQDLTSDRLRMNVTVQQAIREAEPQWKAETNRLETFETERKRTESFFRVVHTKPPGSKWMALLVALRSCVALKSTLYTTYRTTTEQITTETESRSLSLVQKHVNSYRSAFHTILEYVSIMCSHHHVLFQREWQTLADDIRVMEQHLQEFTKTSWSNPEMFDDIQFLSATLMRSTGMFQSFVDDVLKSMQYYHAKQWLLFCRNVLDHEGHVQTAI